MVNFASGYTPPGVYVTADTSAVSSAVGISPTVVCLVGPGLGYQTYIEQITFNNLTDTQNLTQLGIQQNSIVVTDGSTTTYILATDYTLSSSDSSLPDSATTISIVGTGAILPGQAVTVTYNYANAAYFGLNQFGDFISLLRVYGNPLNSTTGALQSPLTLAAQIAFESGANQIYTVALNGLGSLSDQYSAAYALTASSFAINIIVPVFATGTIADQTAFTPYVSGLTGHLSSTETAGFPRVAIVGVPDDLSPTVTPDVLASMFTNRRVTFMWPNQFLYFNSIFNSTVQVGGSFAAASASGLLANQPTNQGLTKRQIRSLSGISAAALATETTINKNLWSSRGVAVIEINRSGQMIIRHGTTTDPSSVVSRELSIVRSQDELFNLMQISLDQAALIGTPITSQTTLAVKGIITGALETALSAGTIQGYTGLSVRQQALPNGDPTVIECVFAYQPTYPLNYITVSFSLDLSTGSITTTTDSAATTTSGA